MPWSQRTIDAIVDASVPALVVASSLGQSKLYTRPSRILLVSIIENYMYPLSRLLLTSIAGFTVEQAKLQSHCSNDPNVIELINYWALPPHL